LSLAQIIEHALRDAEAYRQGGAQGLIVENFGDVPFSKHAVQPHVVAAMTLAVSEIAAATDLPIGVNVLRNDAESAIGIAAMTGAAFVRVNIHTGVMVTDQGVIEGTPDRTMRYRRQLDAPVEVWADLLVKHGVPLGDQQIEEAAEDAVVRGLADAVIVTGIATGKPARFSDLERVRAVLPGTPIYLGSGVSPVGIQESIAHADGFIVGTWAKADGQVWNPVDPGRVEQLVTAIDQAVEAR
jgi:membrane complex biogenesis BtpA family protein